MIAPTPELHIPPSSKQCVFTTMLAGYEDLNEQPTARDSGLPFICLTDDPNLRSETWQVRLVPRLFDMDPIRSQRELKLRPHLHLPEYDFSLYIDNSVLLVQPPEAIIERHFPASGFGLIRHGFRESVLDEFLEVARLGLDDQCRVFEQLNHYYLVYPEVLGERPYWTGLLLRNHRAPEVRAVLDIWSASMMRYSRRDQLSVNAAFRQARLAPDVIDVDNFESAFHLWPHTVGRERERGTRTPAESLALSFSPATARIRQLERELAQITKTREEVLSSGAWRIGHKLARAAERHPRSVGLALQVLGRASSRRRAV